MGKTGKIVLLIASLWPIFYAILFFTVIIGGFFSIASNPTPAANPALPIFGSFAVLFTFHILTMLEIIVLLVIYIRNVLKNENVPQDKRTLWAVILFFGNMIAMPIYWYLYIWRNPKSLASPTAATR